MISFLKLHQIGPAPELEADFGERLNLVTGDNGMGKTFLLDACWYALTQTWADDREFHPAADSHDDKVLDPFEIQDGCFEVSKNRRCTEAYQASW